MPKAPAKPVARPKRPRTEVQEEFSRIRGEVASAKETADPKVEELSRLRDAEVRQAVDGVSVEGVMQKVSSLSFEISRSLSDLSEKMVQEVDRLASVRQAVELERKELARLHNIDVAATAIDQLVQDYGREKERLEAEIAAQRAAWEEETRATERDRKEQEENLKKQRQREIEDYEYKKALERKKAQDKYDEDVKTLEKKNREKQEALEKDWKERELRLKQNEEEFARLKKESEGFPVRLQKEAEQAAAQAAKAAEAGFERQTLLLRKDAESERRLSEMQIKGLETTVAQQAAQITALQKQLEEAKQQVQDIAVKAIEGASGSKALSHINQIAMEQAKTRAKE